MKLLSIKQLWDAIRSVLIRFPFPLFYAFSGTVCALLLTYDNVFSNVREVLIKGVYISNLGLCLSLALALYSEVNPLSIKKKLILNIGIIALLAFLFVWLNPFIRETDVFVLGILCFAAHLLVAIAAFPHPQQNIGFWQLNKNFFLRFAAAVLYGGVLYIGLAIALASIKELFNVLWDYEIYLRLWIIIIGLFTTTFFLSGISKPLQQLNLEYNYPKGLKIFTQYVLIPLSSIYLVILLSYELKIILNGTLPRGMVSNLILGYAVFGMLSLLLVHPLKDLEEHKWIKWYSKSFYLLMIPLLVLLFLAVYVRISTYGVTEGRYILCCLALWLSFITVYFLIKGQNQIRVIPISLVILSLIMVIGPWGMSVVSKKSQQKRLERLLATKNTVARNNEIRSVVKYLGDKHSFTALQPFLKEDLSKINDHFYNNSTYNYSYFFADSVLKLMNIGSEYENDLIEIEANATKRFVNDKKGILDIASKARIIVVKAESYGTDKNIIQEDNLSVIFGKNKETVLVKTPDYEVSFPVDSLLTRLLNDKSVNQNQNLDYTVPSQKLSISKKSGKQNYTLRIEEIRGGLQSYSKKNKVLEISSFSGFLIIMEE